MKAYKLIPVMAFLALGIQLQAKTYPDSVQSASAAELRIREGLNFDLSGGVGFGRFAYKQFSAQSEHVSNALSFPTWNGALGINYYFLPWLGAGTGVQFSTYANTAKVSKPWTYSATDQYGDRYNFIATPNNIIEKQGIYMIEVPLALRFRVIDSYVGFHSALGMKFGMPIKDFYSMSETGATIHNQVEYPSLGWTTRENIPGVIEDAAVAPIKGESSGLNRLNYGAFAEVGMLFRIHQRVDLLLALAATYYVNNVMAAKSATPLGFSEAAKPSQYDLPYAQASYDGVLRTTEVSDLHPWSVVLKLGLSINAGRTMAQHAYDDPEWGARYMPRRDSEPAAEPAPAAVEPVEQSVAEPEPIVEPVKQEEPFKPAEPVKSEEPVKAEEPKPAKPLLQTISIRFELNNDDPILEPADLLEQIAAVLKAHPEQKIQINGHACKLGTTAVNRRIALSRANAVANKLRALGVRSEQIVVKSFGADQPTSTDSNHDLSLDRRVEIIPIVE